MSGNKRIKLNAPAPGWLNGAGWLWKISLYTWNEKVFVFLDTDRYSS